MILTLRLTLDRAAGTIEGGGIKVTPHADSDPLRAWCQAAEDGGIDLAGVRLEMWDCGAWMGDRMAPPMLCMIARDGVKVLHPDPKPRRGEQKEAA